MGAGHRGQGTPRPPEDPSCRPLSQDLAAPGVQVGTGAALRVFSLSWLVEGRPAAPLILGGLLCIELFSFAHCSCHSAHPSLCSHANDLLKAKVELFQNQYHKMQLSSGDLPQHGSPPELVPVLTRGRSRSRLRSSSSAYFGALTVEQKCELAERELLDVKSDIQKMEEDSEKTLHDLEAVIQEADAWWADVKKVGNDFEEDIVRTISNDKGSITASEKLLRYLEEKNHQRDLMRQKLRLESNFLRSYKKKLQQQLRQKEQVGDVLHEVHAELLQVKKAQYEEEIDEKNKELQQLKLALEKTQILDFWKKKLHNAMETSTVLMKDISQRKEMLEKIERNTTLVKEQQAKEERLIGWLQKQLSDYSTPPVMNYVQTMIAVADLKQSIKAWERKVAIAEAGLMSEPKGCVRRRGHTVPGTCLVAAPQPADGSPVLVVLFDDLKHFFLVCILTVPW
uniref:Cilia- and flagella-associated protein 263 n=1 Tax=Meleagris gallopavo TaxID=9103 RepID=G1MX64_MELGA